MEKKLMCHQSSTKKMTEMSKYTFVSLPPSLQIQT